MNARLILAVLGVFCDGITLVPENLERDSAEQPACQLTYYLALFFAVTLTFT